MMQQTVQIDYQNRSARIIVWLAVICYVFTLFLPIIMIEPLMVYSHALIFSILNVGGIVVVFIGLVYAIFAGIFIKKPFLFRITTIFSAGIAIFPLYTILDNIEGFADLNVGFYTYAGGAILSLIASIIYRHKARIQRRVVRQFQQPIQTAQQFYVESPIQHPQTTYQPLQRTEKQVKTLFCSECGIKVSEKDKICQDCGSNLTE